MVTAEKIRKLTEDGKKKRKKADKQAMLDGIHKLASSGENMVVFDQWDDGYDATLEYTDELTRNGFTVFLGKTNGGGNYVKIAW